MTWGENVAFVHIKGDWVDTGRYNFLVKDVTDLL